MNETGKNENEKLKFLLLSWNVRCISHAVLALVRKGCSRTLKEF